MTRAALSLALCALVYPVALGSFHPWDLGLGVLAAGALLAVFRRHLFPQGMPPVRSLGRRILWLPVLAAAVVKEITVGAWQVALIVLHVRPLRRPGIVRVPYGERSPGGVVAAAVFLTLSPGEVLVELDDEGGAMLIHAIDASDPDAVRERHDRFYRRYQRQVVP